MTIYVPDDLGAEVKAELGDSNVSAVCQAALRAELARVRARAARDEEGYKRIEVHDSKKDHDVAFRGDNVGETRGGLQVYITPKHAIAVYDPGREELYVYDGWAQLDSLEQENINGPDTDLLALVAEALGEEYVEELDI